MLYNRAILIPSSSPSSSRGEEEPSEEMVLRAYSTIVVFNLAICHQIISSRTKKFATTYLDKAKGLYASALKLTDSCCCFGGFFRTALVVRLASINNLSQIRVSCGDYRTDDIDQVLKALKGGHHILVSSEPQLQRLLIHALFLKDSTIKGHNRFAEAA